MCARSIAGMGACRHEETISAILRCPSCGPPTLTAPAARSSTLPILITAALPLVGSLTARESAAFELLGLGYDNRSIARTLSISERTAKRHITGVLTKLRLESRLQAGIVSLIARMAVSTEPNRRIAAG